jgi:hypothetical protein
MSGYSGHDTLIAAFGVVSGIRYVEGIAADCEMRGWWVWAKEEDHWSATYRLVA